MTAAVSVARERRRITLAMVAPKKTQDASEQDLPDLPEWAEEWVAIERKMLEDPWGRSMLRRAGADAVSSSLDMANLLMHAMWKAKLLRAAKKDDRALNALDDILTVVFAGFKDGARDQFAELQRAAAKHLRKGSPTAIALGRRSVAWAKVLVEEVGEALLVSGDPRSFSLAIARHVVGTPPLRAMSEDDARTRLLDWFVDRLHHFDTKDPTAMAVRCLRACGVAPDKARDAIEGATRKADSRRNKRLGDKKK